MKTLEEVIRLKEGLEGRVIHQPHVNGIDVGSVGTEGAARDALCIRIYVSSPAISHADLGVPETYEGVPIVLKAITIHPQ